MAAWAREYSSGSVDGRPAASQAYTPNSSVTPLNPWSPPIVMLPSCRAPLMGLRAAREDTCTPSGNHCAERPVGWGTMLRESRTLSFAGSGGPAHGMSSGGDPALVITAWGAAVCRFIEMTREKLPSPAAAFTIVFALPGSSKETPRLIVNGLKFPESDGIASHGTLMPVLPSRR